MDLVTDAPDLPCRAYDVILHVHVMEHIPCNVTAVLFHLHRALKDDGIHIFSFPIYGGHYDESLADLLPKERAHRFGQDDHTRRFGANDIHVTLGMIFEIPETYNLQLQLPNVDWAEINVPDSALSGFSSNSVFAMRKSDLLLNAEKP